MRISFPIRFFYPWQYRPLCKFIRFFDHHRRHIGGDLSQLQHETDQNPFQGIKNILWTNPDREYYSPIKVSWNLNLFDYVFSQMNLTSKTENLVYTRFSILEIFKQP